MKQHLHLYQGKDNYGKPKRDFMIMVHHLTDDELVRFERNTAYFHVYAANNPGSDWHHEHYMTQDEIERRRDPVKEFDIVELLYDQVDHQELLIPKGSIGTVVDVDLKGILLVQFEDLADETGWEPQVSLFPFEVEKVK